MYIFLTLLITGLWWTNGLAQILEQQCTILRDSFVSDAQVRFAFMISLRKRDSSSPAKQINSCALINKDSLQNLLAAEWVVERLNKANNGTGYIPGIKFGFEVLDDCQSPESASRNALTFVEGWLPSWLRNCTKPTETYNIGIIGPSRSATALRVASLLKDINVTIISYAATNEALSNKVNFPTFLRTVPSDVDQMTMIASLLKQLNWTYVVIAHKSNDYGTSGAKLLKGKSEELGICVQKVLPVTELNHNSDFSRDLINLLEQTKDYSMALVFIGSRDDAENLMFIINNLPQTNRISKYGLHVILSDSANTDASIYTDKNYGFGTFSVATSDLVLEDVLSDLQSKFRAVKEKTGTHKLIKEFVEDFPKEELFPDNHHNAFVPMTIHAIFALVEGFRIKYNQLCDGSGKICNALTESLQSGDLLERVFNVEVKYGEMNEGIAPDMFKKNKYVISFDDNGNINQTNHVPSYTVFQYQGKYVPVGAYIDNKLHLNMSLIQMKTPSGANTTTIPSSVCYGRCDGCLSPGKIPVAHLIGDYYILGIFSVHDPGDKPTQCGQFRYFANDVVAVEGFFYAVKQLRARTGINFGALAIDDCYSPVRATTILSSYFSDMTAVDNPLFDMRIPISKIVGVVGCLSSSCTIPTTSFFTPHKVPVISYASSTPDLDDKVNYPYFLRTVPSDVFQAKVMLQVIQTLKWQYVGLLYIRNNYGTKAMQAFKSLALAENSSVCVAEENGIGAKDSDLDERDFYLVFSKLSEQQVKVVVFFGIHARYLAFLKYLEKKNYWNKFIFLGSEDWGKYENILEAAPKASRGSITLKLEEISLESDDDFQNYLAIRKPQENDLNIWFSEFWQNEFTCNMKGGFINIFDKECDSSNNMDPASVTTRANEQRVKQAINAVYALGYGWRDARVIDCENQTDCLRQKVDKVVEKIKAVKRQQGNKQYSVFDSDGNGAIGFTVYNVQQEGPNKNAYVKVGSFNKDSCFQTKDLIFYSESGKPLNEISALCTPLLCNHNQCPRFYATQKQIDGTVQGPLADLRKTDVLVISLILVLLLAIAVAVAINWICFRYFARELKKKLDYKLGHEMYAEPDDVMYQPYSETHGIKFANKDMDPYYGEEMDTLRGITNPSFVHDNADVASLSASQRSRPGSRPHSRVNAHCQSFSRPLPISPIGDLNIKDIMHDNLAYVDSMSENNFLPSVTTSSQIAHNSNHSSFRNESMLRKRSLDTQPMSTTQYVTVQQGAGMVGMINQRGQPQQLSVRSNASTIHLEYGPYSSAAAQHQRMFQGSNIQSGPQPALRELNMMATSLAQQDNSHGLQHAYPESRMDYFPIHYASTPIASGQMPRPQVFQSLESHSSLANEQTNAYIIEQLTNNGGQALEMARMTHPGNSQNNQQSFSGNEQRPQYQNSNVSLAGATDHSSPPQELQQQISMESIDLNSNIDTLKEVQFSPTNAPARTGSFFHRILRGNVTNV